MSPSTGNERNFIFFFLNEAPVIINIYILVHHQQSIIVQPCVDKPASRECSRGSFEEPQIFLTSFQGPHRNIPGAPLLNVISPPSPCFPPSVYISQTANSMLWAIFNLSRNPGAQKRLLEEIRTVVPPDQDPCGEHIKSMPFLKACLKESMRYSRTAGGGWGGGGGRTLRALTTVALSDATRSSRQSTRNARTSWKPQAAQY